MTPAAGLGCSSPGMKYRLDQPHRDSRRIDERYNHHSVSRCRRPRGGRSLNCSPKGDGACWLPRAASHSTSLHDQADRRSFCLCPNLGHRAEAHDAAFGELIMASGHLEKVLATLDEGVVQTFYDVVS